MWGWRDISPRILPPPALVEKCPGTPWIGGCLGLGAVLDSVAKRSVACPCKESSSNSSFVQYIYWAATSGIISIALWYFSWFPTQDDDVVSKVWHTVVMFEVLTIVSIRFTAFLDATTCSLADKLPNFGKNLLPPSSTLKMGLQIPQGLYHFNKLLDLTSK